jgi:hypothetical protein
MEMWQKILWALTLGAMVVFLLPRAKEMLAQSAQAENKDWKGVIFPIAMVVLFVILLIMLT